MTRLVAERLVVPQVCALFFGFGVRALFAWWFWSLR
jgi:hypothetical protein